jgi:hypothetical protein
LHRLLPPISERGDVSDATAVLVFAVIFGGVGLCVFLLQVAWHRHTELNQWNTRWAETQRRGHTRAEIVNWPGGVTTRKSLSWHVSGKTKTPTRRRDDYDPNADLAPTVEISEAWWK